MAGKFSPFEEVRKRQLSDEHGLSGRLTQTFRASTVLAAVASLDWSMWWEVNLAHSDQL